MNVFSHKPPRRRTARKQQTRDALITAARARFAAHGFEGTTIRDVAAQAGVAVGTVFVHFPDKTALLAATLDDQIATALAAAFATLPNASARVRVRHLIEALMRIYARTPALARVLLREALFLGGDGGRRLDARLDAFVAALSTLLSAPGALRRGLQPDDAAYAIFAAYVICLVDGLRARRFDVARQVAECDRLIAPWFPVAAQGLDA